jgi:hypothetical protein
VRPCVLASLLRGARLIYITARHALCDASCFAAQWAGLALAGHAAKDMAVSVRSTKTKSEARDACKIAGLSWLASSGYRHGTLHARRRSVPGGARCPAALGAVVSAAPARVCFFTINRR